MIIQESQKWKRRFLQRWLRVYGNIKSRIQMGMKSGVEDNYPIDFVVTWVDGSDSEWIKEKDLYMKLQNAPYSCNSNARWRDWDILRYWFRSAENYAPWIHRIYLVTNGQKPEWLNAENDRICLISHEEFIPAEYLPTFCSDNIELNLWRIPGLSEHFVYFNDDIVLNRPVQPSDFFHEGLPKCCSVAKPLYTNKDVVKWYQRWLNDYAVINESFNIRTAFQRYPEKFYSHIYSREEIRWNYNTYIDNYVSGSIYTHSAQAFLKSTFQELWNRHIKQLDETCKRKFRTPDDQTIFLVTLWQIFSGRYSPVQRNFYGPQINLSLKEIHRIKQSILSEQYRTVCLNDTEMVDAESEEVIQEIKDIIIQTYEEKLPEKSGFEK